MVIVPHHIVHHGARLSSWSFVVLAQWLRDTDRPNRVLLLLVQFINLLEVLAAVPRNTIEVFRGPSVFLPAKSVHMRLVHSAGGSKGLFHSHSLHRRRDRGVVIDGRQFVSPGAIDVEMLDDIGHQIAQPFACVVAGAEVMHVAKGALDWVRAGAIGRQKEQLKARLLG